MQVVSHKKALLYVSLAISIFALAVYLNIDAKSYFFQDDFFLLPKYTSSISLHMFDPATNFGRPVTRDLYFYLINNLLGEGSFNYFIVNIIIIVATTFFIFRTLTELNIDNYIAGTAALVYFYMAPTVPHASWISNSQHTLAHLFSFCFISSALSGINTGRIRSGQMIIIYLLAMFSNVSSFFALIFVWAYLLVRWVREQRRERAALYVILGVLTVATAGWSLFISHSAPSPYKLNFTLAHTLDNARYYDDLFSHGALAQHHHALFVVMALITLLNFRRNYVAALPILGGLCTSFGMIFFLGGQRTLGYMALPYALFGMLFFSNFASSTFKDRAGRSLLLVFVSYLFVFYTLQSGAIWRNFFDETPYGSGIQEILSTVQNVKVSKDTTFCFGPPADEAERNEYGFSTFWLFIGNGLAFDLIKFNDSYARKYLYVTDPECKKPGVVNVEIGQRGSVLTVKSIRQSD